MKSNLPPAKRPKPNGFSLLELLVAIAVIAVLAVLIFVSSKSISKKTASIRCMSNLRAVGGLILKYAQDNNQDLIPWLTYAGPNQGSHWLYWLWATDYLPRESYDNRMDGVMTCPSRGVAGSYDAYSMHYGMNSFPSFDNQINLGEPFHKFTKIQRPSQTLLLADANNLFYFMPGMPQSFAYPHHNHSNAIFMDGHMEALKGPISSPVGAESWPWY